MYSLETLKKLNDKKVKESVCPKCEGKLEKSPCAGLSSCKECGWVVQDD